VTIEKYYSNKLAALSALLHRLERQVILLASQSKQKKTSKFLTICLFVHSRDGLYAVLHDFSNSFIGMEKWRFSAYPHQASNQPNRHIQINRLQPGTMILCSNHSAAAKRSSVFQKVIVNRPGTDPSATRRRTFIVHFVGLERMKFNQISD
jgi:hypothetical protein